MGIIGDDSAVDIHYFGRDDSGDLQHDGDCVAVGRTLLGGVYAAIALAYAFLPALVFR